MRRSSKLLSNAKQPGAGDTVTGLVTFLVGAAIVAYLFVTNGDYKPKEMYWFINTGLCLWVPMMVIVCLLGKEPSEFGLQRGDAKLGLRWSLLLWTAMLIPAIVESQRP